MSNMSEHRNESTAIAVGYQESDIINIADNFGTVVAPDPKEGVAGFASFAYEEFINFSKALIVDVRNDMLRATSAGIENDTDLAIANAVLAALSSTLYQKYGPLEFEWPISDKYVEMYQFLYKTVFDYNRSRNPIVMRREQWEHAHNG